ncbi:conjugal transfer protein TrbJ [Synergistales bacterium]|nr:conjugal transfer protein TrbJ [Synergistales bacterium]
MKGLGNVRKIIAMCVLSCSVVNIILAGVGIAFAGGGGLSGGATEITQRMNNSELAAQVKKSMEQINNQITQISNEITMITNQITMIQDAVYNTFTIPDQIFNEVKRVYAKVNGVISKTKGIAYNLANMDEELIRRFKSYGDISSFANVVDLSTEYRSVVNTQMETVRTTMEAIGVSMEELTNDDASALKELQRKASSAKGRNELIQATNQLLAFLAEDAMKLRQLLMMQAQMTGVALEAERTKEDIALREREKFMKPSPSVKPYINRGNLDDNL